MNTDLINTLQETILGILGIGLSFTTLFIIYKAFQLKNKEKLALIEKGMDPSLAETKPKSQHNSFKNGLMLIGVALGVFVGYILNITLGVPNFVAYSTMILVFCGILLVYFHKTKKV